MIYDMDNIITVKPCFYTVSGKNIPGIFDFNLKKDYQILIIFDNNISVTTGNQTTVHFSTAHAHVVCFCTTWENKTMKIFCF